MTEQKVKVVNLSTKGEVFFFDCMNKTAYQRAIDYVYNNKTKFSMDIYLLSGRKKPFDKWHKFNHIEQITN